MLSFICMRIEMTHPSDGQAEPVQLPDVLTAFIPDSSQEHVSEGALGLFEHCVVVVAVTQTVDPLPPGLPAGAAWMSFGLPELDGRGALPRPEEAPPLTLPPESPVTVGNGELPKPTDPPASPAVLERKLEIS